MSEVYCDMATDGGGWMLLGKKRSISIKINEIEPVAGVWIGG
ncbi:MAG TPA: hypothetical protein ENJ18_09690 [Nannocystis exedens]|nr:hypothetical protein [Nannocystis exedens]